MEKIIRNGCLRAVMLLLCIFVTQCLACRSLENLDYKARESSIKILQVAIQKIDYPLFLEKVQELELVW